MSSKYSRELTQYEKQIPDNTREAFREKDYKNAIPGLEKVVAKHPKNWLALTLLGTAYKNLGKYRKAISVFKKSALIEPRFFVTWDGLGESQTKLKYYKSAIDSYMELMRLTDKSYPAIFVAVLWHMRGRPELAMLMLEHLEGKFAGEDLSLVHYVKSLLHKMEGETAEALFELINSRAETTDPEFAGKISMEIYDLADKEEDSLDIE